MSVHGMQALAESIQYEIKQFEIGPTEILMSTTKCDRLVCQSCLEEVKEGFWDWLSSLIIHQIPISKKPWQSFDETSTDESDEASTDEEPDEESDEEPDEESTFEELNEKGQIERLLEMFQRVLQGVANDLTGIEIIFLPKSVSL